MFRKLIQDQLDLVPLAPSTTSFLCVDNPLSSSPKPKQQSISRARIYTHFRHPLALSRGPEDRDAAFMERLRCLAREALSWAWLTPQQRLVWAAAIELDAVPLQERFGTGDTGLALEDQRILEDC